MANLFGKTAIAMAAMSMAAAPALAQGSALSLRASTKADKESSIAGPPVIAIVGLLAIVGAGIYIAVDDEDSPDSP